MTQETNEETIAATSRKSALTTLIAIALSPISLFLGYFLNHVLQSPKLHIEYVTPIAVVESQKFDSRVLKSLTANRALVQHLRGVLTNYGSGDSAPPTAWLDGQPWDDAFLPAALDSLAGIAGQLDADIELLEDNLAALQEWTPPGPVELRPLPNPDLTFTTALARQDKSGAIAALNGQLKALKKEREPIDPVLQELSRIRDSKDEMRTGEIDILVGVLNSGDSDGVVLRDANVHFAESELPFRAGEYTVIKGHSFGEVEFVVNSSSATKASLDRWSSLVTKRQQEKFVISIGAGGKTLNGDGRLPE